MKNLQEKSKSVTLPAFDSSVKWNIQINFIDSADESTCLRRQCGQKKPGQLALGPG